MARTYPEEILDTLVEEYQSGKSLQEMYSQRGISPVVLRKELERRGVPIRRQKTAREIIAELEAMGVTEKIIARSYLVDNCGKQDLKELIFLSVGHRVGDRCLNKILELTNLHKSVKAIRELQGSRSRDLHSFMLNELDRAGFSSLDSLGDYYTENVELTSESLATLLNKELGRETFSKRWIDRHIISAGRTPRLKGSSRTAKAFGAWLDTIYSGTVKVDYRGLITPYEVDFYLEGAAEAVEFNGDYWHSDKFLMANHSMTAREYHEMKLRACSEKGVTLVFVWESDWTHKRELVTEVLENFLANSEIHPMLRRLTPP